MSLATRIRWLDGVVYASGGISYRSRYGESPTPSGAWTLTDGTGSGKANDVYEKVFTIVAGATLSVDLKGGGGELNVANLALAFTAVKSVEVIITTAPASGVSLLVGPQGVTNAAQLWFQAATANFYDTVRDRFGQFDRATGWALDATHKILPLKNPGASSVSGWLRVIGER